jgi:hypothetical protein
VCISLLRNEAVLCDIRKAGHRVSAAVRCINFFSTEFHRFYACHFTCSSDAAACDREVALSGGRRLLAFA